ncbi:MAG: methylated-DNA--[protein]-cysteine S-methyltransferase [Clostridiales bacterium]|nr:methylated-DNA--[protein]-cysteine S-methyltransferase [Clostridiales bacterium]
MKVDLTNGSPNEHGCTMGTIMVTHYQSPVGEMIIGSYGDRLCLCDWAIVKRRDTIDRRLCRSLNAEYEEGTSDIIKQALAQLDEYFAGKRKEFSIPVVFTGSPFQCSVWAELMKIPYGSTISYTELARRINNPRAVRAVASANATNPISIFVPCHRVIGSNHKLTGYAGGLDAKRGLLALEARIE